MGQPTQKTILFLCTGNYYRSRFAEILFNDAARKFGMSWTATSKGLALERGVNNVGPIAPSAIEALEGLGIRSAECGRSPQHAKRRTTRSVVEPMMMRSFSRPVTNNWLLLMNPKSPVRRYGPAMVFDKYALKVCSVSSCRFQ